MRQERVWYASPNGDWWTGSESDFVFVLKESDLPADIDPDSIEGDKFEDIITEHGTTVYIESE
jgi:hypothetical protein